ncbi:MAG: TonB-dependent receptor [Chitinophagaceae bacterium]
MPKRLLLLFALIFICLAGFTQKTLHVSGKLIDSSGVQLGNTTIKLTSETDSLTGITDNTGAFAFNLRFKAIVTIEITRIGYATYRKQYRNAEPVLKLGTIILLQEPETMGEVIVRSVSPILIKEDTVQFNVSSYKVREGAPVEDVVKKLPGVTVDKDGQVTAQGKPVARIRVNGKDFFGGDVQTALQNLPADVIENIQIIDDYGDQANLSGIKSNEPEKIININIRKDKNHGRFGTATAAAGDQHRYAGALMGNYFKDQQQVSVIGAINNTNANLFNFNGGGNGGGARGVNFGNAERALNGGNGISTSKSAGFNYKDNWGSKIAVNGSYSFTSRNTSSSSVSQQQDINPANIRFTERISERNFTDVNHRATFNMEYRMDSMNFLKVSPYLSLSSSESAGSGQSAISRKGYYTFNKSESSSSSKAPNGGTDLLFNHKFSKRGRNISLFTSINYSYRNQYQRTKNNYANDDSTFVPVLHKDTIQQQHVDIMNRNLRTVVKLSYTEPIANNTFLELSYEWNRSATNNKRTVEDIDPVSLVPSYNDVQSNYFNYQFVTNRIGLNIKGNHPKYYYVIGVVSQPSALSGQSVSKRINTEYNHISWLPVGRFVYNFAKSHNLTITYNGNSREPEFMQIQPVTDSSNLNNIIIGNPDLQAELTRRFGIQYNKFDNKTGRSLFTNFFFNQTDNKIVYNRVNNASGTGRTTSYLNTNGFYNVNADGSMTRPFSNKRFFITVAFNGSYGNNISFTDNQRNKGNNWSVRPSTNFRIDIADKIDAAVSASYTIYHTTTRYTSFTNTTKARILNLGINGKTYFFKDFTIGYDLNKIINYGFSNNVSSNPTILNVFTEYRFLKKRHATVRLQGFDLFNQNEGISRTINETTITDSRNNRLARYFLLSFNFRLQQFGGNRERG